MLLEFTPKSRRRVRYAGAHKILDDAIDYAFASAADVRKIEVGLDSSRRIWHFQVFFKGEPPDDPPPSNSPFMKPITSEMWTEIYDELAAERLKAGLLLPTSPWPPEEAALYIREIVDWRADRLLRRAFV
jgi:hypothetical protein